MQTQHEDRVNTNIRYTSEWWAMQGRVRSFFSFSEKLHTRLLFRHLSTYPTGRKVLVDIGFGTGRLIGAVGKKLGEHGTRVLGFDISRRNVFSFTRNARRSSYRRAITVLPMDPYREVLCLKDGSVDYVCCSHVLEHVGNDKGMLEEIHRVLKVSGRAFVMIPINEEQWDVPTHMRKYTSAAFKKMIKQRFTVEYEEENNVYSRALTFCALRCTFHFTCLKRMLIFVLSLTPYEVVAAIDGLLLKAGLKPSQAFFILRKSTAA